MNQKAARFPNLIRAYQNYLTDEDTAQFIRAIASRYSLETLLRLADSSDALVRRAAVLAVGMLGDLEATNALGPMLADRDRRVRLVTDDAIKSIWLRAAEPRARIQLERLLVHIEANRMEQAKAVADELIESYPDLPEAFCRRALVHFNLGNVVEAIADCRHCLRLNPFSYMAHVGLGQCLLEQDEPHEALAAFREALSIYPDLDTVLVQVKRLERMLREMT